MNDSLPRFACLLPIFRQHKLTEDRESLFCLAVFRFAEREGQMCSGATPNSSAISLSPLGQWRLRAFASVEDASLICGKRRTATPLLFQRRDNVGGMPVGLYHAVTSSINFTLFTVRSQRGALSSAAKYQTSSHSNPVSVCSIFGSNAPPRQKLRQRE